MTLISLCIETSDEICSVSLNNKGRLTFLESEEVRSHGKIITTLINELLQNAMLEFNQIDFIAISSGPGSYTGLRIGVATAKGLCYSLQKPLVSIDVFDILKEAARSGNLSGNKNLVAMIDARRMEVYSQKWDKSGNKITDPCALILDEGFIADNSPGDSYLIGSGAFKANDIKDGIKYDFRDIRPHAKFMNRIAEEKFEVGQLEDTAYFEPFYLKEFYITKAKNPLKSQDGK